MSEIKCLVCGGNYFRKGYYDVGVNVEVRCSSFDDVHIDVDINTSIHNEVDESADISFMLISEEDNNYGRYDKPSEACKYNCEKCGFIMSFTEEKNVESIFEEKKRKQKERKYDWSGFGE
ncbi:hypothetical protein ACQKK2_13095 [Bacillus paranthracis]|uniref:Uncharacterized protein n=1 Tax=Bacillus cereus (strain Q1) TaxID=361100 RepID=B9IU69_BACCQ|nr:MULTISPECIES: hypothetical protein [Bacillus cereus group]ACM11765.1 conserved hypothetical protein [Bacillus cereus Q1]MBY5228170.1 hypothetical protein [Bacillus paranthracis]MCY9250741.1 hypothetical protein [Bacillus paranthracis]MDA1497809.1 hypothetical protein [Bacillus cereus group sp. TH41-1LC]MDA1684129.1 hypothetical protein [Bacillus cereus group sp. m2-21]